jgi:hypothetical protein
MTDVGGVTSTFTQVLSDDAVYEYRADRWWAEGPRLAFVGCNPSLITWHAGGRLDPTSANCEAIARRDGYAGVTMLNLWALRGTDPRELRGHRDPVGPGWAEAFDEAVRDVGFVVGAWGAWARRRTANRAICRCEVCRGAPCRHCNRSWAARRGRSRAVSSDRSLWVVAGQDGWLGTRPENVRRKCRPATDR